MGYKSGHAMGQWIWFEPDGVLYLDVVHRKTRRVWVRLL